MSKQTIPNPSREPETAFLVGIERPAGGVAGADGTGGLLDSLAELKELTRTAGLAVVGETFQRLKDIHPGTLIGPGKVEEIRRSARALEADVVLFDDELSPGQQKNLEKEFGEDLRVLDRTALILDVFAMHAHSNEGKLQVELAQYAYRLPRLTRMWTHLARQAGGRRGGVGLRGPGETQLEIDRRAVRRKIAFLEKAIETVRGQREKLRDRRRSEGLFTAALAGYTNAGKSTLLNAMSRAGIATEDKLFSTLDPTTRRVRLPGGLTVLVTDTVGFISKLPHNLVAAFRATFEEIGAADLVLHLVDASHPDSLLHRRVVERELERTLGTNVPVLTVWNKTDLLPEEARQALFSDDGRVAVSALSGEGLPGLLREMERRFASFLVPVVLRIPYPEGRHLALVHACGSGVEETPEDSATLVRALVPPSVRDRLRRFLVGEPSVKDEHR